MTPVQITAVGHYVPSRKLTNADLEKIVDTSDEWIVTRTGIKERRIAGEHEKTSHLAIEAARQVLHNAKIAASKIDLIIVATTSPDSNFPSVACLVQKALGARSAIAFDVSAACTGFIYAISVAHQFLLAKTYKNALVIAADRLTTMIDWQDRNTCVLFGDGAGACLLESGDKKGILAEHLESYGEYGELMKIIVPETRHPLKPKHANGVLPYIQMQGPELFKIAVNSMADCVEKALEKAKITISEVACVVPHQANDRIISAVAKKLDIPKEKFFINIEKYGNMSAASAAVALFEAVELGRIRKGDYAVLVAFGAGLVAGAIVIKWQ
ncbi:MAG TPA: beta-ketoacyl-ACP synthase III [Candidatus Omnitrophota bacterium]|mgnify:CR=1 FL=1|nr:beta-ketoacyl-ACP synthase III [Candidatus Omnitrophota bacterium]HQL41030.1 beta-ketoacyl-ACP synthase III [Candidatus Omnitrophota bacterium]